MINSWEFPNTMYEYTVNLLRINACVIHNIHRLFMVISWLKKLVVKTPDSIGQLFSTTMWPTVMQLAFCGQLVFFTSVNTKQLRADYKKEITLRYAAAWVAQWGLDHRDSWLIEEALKPVCGLHHIKVHSVDLDSHAGTGYSHSPPFTCIYNTSHILFIDFAHLDTTSVSNSPVKQVGDTQAPTVDRSATAVKA